MRTNTREDKTFRAAVRKRDGYMCRRCKKRGWRILQVHHIKKYADHPLLRRTLSNAITICKQCHEQMRGSEEQWERMCKMIIGDPRIIATISERLNKMKEEEERDE